MRKEEATNLYKDVCSLQNKAKGTDAFKEEFFCPVDFKEWVLQWFSRRDIIRVTGTILETWYRNAMKDLDKVTAHNGSPCDTERPRQSTRRALAIYTPQAIQA